MVAGDADQIAKAAQPLETRHCIGIEIACLEDITIAAGGPLPPRGFDIKAGLESFKDAVMVLAAGNRLQKGGPESILLDAEVVGPRRPQALLAEEGLADIEEHDHDRHVAKPSRKENSSGMRLRPDTKAFAHLPPPRVSRSDRTRCHALVRLGWSPSTESSFSMRIVRSAPWKTSRTAL
jgi:hypothetical protein